MSMESYFPVITDGGYLYIRCLQLYFKLILGVYQLEDKAPILPVFLLVEIARQSDWT